MAYDSHRGISVVFGGLTDTGNLALLRNDTWENDGSGWAQRLSSHMPPPTAGASLTFDSVRGVVWAYGGYSQVNGQCVQLGALWKWDGSNWEIETVIGQQPDARRYACFAYDSARDVLVLHGGIGTTCATNAPQYGDTWEFQPTLHQWVQASIAGPIAGQSQMAYDTERGVCVLFLGHVVDGVVQSEVWEWEGNTANWVFRQAISASSARLYPAVVYNPHSSSILVYGGFTDSSLKNPLGDLWEWDGFVWQLVHPSPGGPSARGHACAAFAADRASLVVFSGIASYNATHLRDDTWEWSACDGPADASTCLDGFIALSADCASIATMHYQWEYEANFWGSDQWFSLEDGVLPDSMAHVSGSHSNTLAIQQIDASSARRFRCLVQSDCAAWFTRAATLRICPPDFDCSGFLDTDDFTAFIRAFETGDAEADFDGTGFVDTDDFTAFVLAFEAGC